MQVYLNEYQVRGTGNMVQYVMKVGKNITSFHYYKYLLVLTFPTENIKNQRTVQEEHSREFPVMWSGLVVSG